MTRKVEQRVLTEHQQLKYQRRLSSYLKDHEYRNNLKTKELAQKINISPEKMCYVKSETKPYGKFINSIDYLAKLADLEQMSVIDFMNYLEGQKDKDVHEEHDEKKVFKWQKALIRAFEPISIKIRNTFLKVCDDSGKEGKEKLETLIEINSILAKKDLKALKLLKQTLEEIT